MWLTYLVVPQYSISASFTRATLHPIQKPIENETLTQIILGMNDIHNSLIQLTLHEEMEWKLSG